MSLILVYMEDPDPPSTLRPSGLAVFPVSARIARQTAIRHAIALTDGVASDRFVAFGDDTRGREGAKLRKVLIEFLESRVNSGSKVYLKLLFSKGPVDGVIFDVKAAKRYPLRHLRDGLKTLQPGDVLEVTGNPP